VAFPTETVYGLGANAFDLDAIDRVYALKQRPRTSPLIVHVIDTAAARELTAEWPDAAERLAARFWPGPLTLIVPKAPEVPDAVTAGLATVGLRVPAHPVARRLLELAGVPIAAPSANPFTRLSATHAEHVRTGFGDRIEHVLDGGQTPIGIESTVVSFAEKTPRLLRPGAIPMTAVRRLVPDLLVAGASPATEGAHESPGQHRRHYSPRTPVLLLPHEAAAPAGNGAWLHRNNKRDEPRIVNVAMPDDAAGYAAMLYATLHDLDSRRLEWIAIESLPDDEAWDAIRDRLDRARG